jgi:zinc/manganese transport system permease protein
MSLFAEISPWRLMSLPFLECLVLVGIHSYLGLHVIRRQVIFVDLSLAQIAALGTTVGFLAGIHPGSTGAFLFSLSFTFLGAGVFALTRTSKRERVPQEAIIGLVYALAAALVILVIDRAPHGAEHIKETLTGTLLWVSPREVLTAAIAYLGVGIFHWIFREKFMAITNDARAAREQGLNVVLWDLLFYMSFGFVITFSVNTAGVLLVFVFLVVPAVIGASITDNFRNQLLIGWGLGLLVSVVGLALSYWLNLPTGPAVVALYGLVLLIVALVLHVVRSERPGRALGHIGAGIVVVALVVGYFQGLRHVIREVPALSRDHHAAPPDMRPRSARKETAEKRFDQLDLVAQEQAARKMKDLGQLQAFFVEATTPGAKLELAERVVQLDPRAGAPLLMTLLESDAPVWFQEKALKRLETLCQKPFKLDLMEDPPEKVKDVVGQVRRCVETFAAPAGPAPAPVSPPGAGPSRPEERKD